MIAPRLPVALVALVLSAGVLTGCATSAGTPVTTQPASSAASTDGPLVTPVTMSANDLQGATVKLEVGQVLDIGTGDLAVDSYSAKVADTSVAQFTQGEVDGGATFDPGVTALAEGTTEVTLTNSDGGIQPLTFTVEVSASDS